MEYFDYALSWLAGNPKMVTAWAVVIMLALAWLWRGHRASKERAVFKSRLRTQAEQARFNVAGTVYTPKAHRRDRPRR